MLAICALSIAAALGAWVALDPLPDAFAQSPPRAAYPGVVSDDDLTLVVGTHFVSSPTDNVPMKSQFDDARIPLSRFNETDDCIDQSALDAARNYFNVLGRMLGKAGYFYVIPDADVAKAEAMCEKLRGRPPQAWVKEKTKIIAFGKVVPTVDAPALAQSIR